MITSFNTTTKTAFRKTCLLKALIWRLLCCINLLLYYAGYNCMNPPPIPANTNLVSNYDIDNPPAIDDEVTYTCNTGGHNRFKGDYSKSSASYTCLKDNILETPNPWPICLDGMNF